MKRILWCIALAMTFMLSEKAIGQQPMPVALFSMDTSQICEGGSISFTNLSTGNIVSQQWTFNGSETYQWLEAGNPPPIVYRNWNNGGFMVYLQVEDEYGNIDTYQDHITVWPKPNIEVVSPSDNAHICTGDSQLVTVMTNALDPTFLWFTYEQGELFTTNNDSVFLRQQGNHRVTVFDERGCESEQYGYFYLEVHQPILISFNDNWGVDQESDTLSLCHNENNWLYANVQNLEHYDWTNFAWNDGTLGTSTQIDSTGLYKLTVIDETNACGSAADSLFVMVHQLPLPEIVISPNQTSFCEGDVVTVSTATPYAEINWQWNNGFYSISTDMETIHPESSGIYTVIVTDEFGCRGIMESQFISIRQRPEKPDIFVANGCMLAASSAPTGTSYEYQWYTQDGILSGAMEQYFNSTDAGFYTVSITAENGCSNMSDPTYADCDISSIESLTNAGISMYPNPFVDILSLRFNDNELVIVSCIDMTGRIVDTQSGQGQIIFNGNNLAPGIYSLKINTKDSEVTTKVIKL
jgi:PKD repeat protein